MHGLSELSYPLSHVIWLNEAKTWFIFAPATIWHVLILVCMLAIVPASFRMKRDFGARFVCAVNLALVMYLFNPPLVFLLSKILKSRLILRVVWLFPVGLSCAWFFSQLFTWSSRLKGWRRKWAIVGASCILVATWALTLRPTTQGMMRMEVFYPNFSTRPLTQMFADNKERFTNKERVAMPVSYGCWIVPFWPRAEVLTFRHQCAHPDAWSLMCEIYNEGDRLAQSSGTGLTLGTLEMLHELNISHVVVPRGNTLRVEILRYPHVFKEVYASNAYLLYRCNWTDFAKALAVPIAVPAVPWIAVYTDYLVAKERGDMAEALVLTRSALAQASEPEPLLMRLAAETEAVAGDPVEAQKFYRQFSELVGMGQDTAAGRWYALVFAARVGDHEEVIRRFEALPLPERTHTPCWEYMKSLKATGRARRAKYFGWFIYLISGNRDFRNHC